MENEQNYGTGLDQRSSGQKAPKFVLGAGILACALCCSAPLLIGLGIGGAALTALAAHAEKISAGLLALAVVTYFVMRYRAARRTGATCSVDCASRPANKRQA